MKDAPGETQVWLATDPAGEFAKTAKHGLTSFCPGVLLSTQDRYGRESSPIFHRSELLWLTSLSRLRAHKMTVAVCLKCGALKHGAWTPCPKCKHTPEDPEDKAKHVMTSDHYFSKADLESISTRVQSGQPLHFDQKQVEELTTTMATVNPEKSVRLFVYGCFAIIIAVIVGAIYLMARFALR